MEFSLLIIRNGLTEDTMKLAGGHYTVGRSGGCDIVLNHSSISKKHAVIRVADDKVTVEDAGSVNGIFDKNEKITKRTYSGGFQLAMGPFTLKGSVGGKAVAGVPGDGGKAAGGLSRTLARLDLRLVLFVFFALLVAVAYWGIQKPVTQEAVSFKQEEITKRRILLARYLSEINRYAVENNEPDKLRVEPVNLEEEVAYAYVVNTDGQVLAPLEDRGDFLDWAEFSTAVKNGAITVGKGKGGEQVVFYPLKVFNRLMAAAVVGYASGDADLSQSPGGSTGTYALLFILLALGGVLAALSLKLFLKPLKDLEEEVRVALKNNRTGINFRAPYKEIEELAQAFSRLLAKTPVSAAAPVSPREKAAAPSAATGKKSIGAFEELAGLEAAWCVLDTVENQITRFNEGFRTLFDNQKPAEGMHILEVFQEPNMLRAVSNLTDAPEQVCAEIEETDPPMQIRKKPVPEDTGKMILIFEEQIHV